MNISDKIETDELIVLLQAKSEEAFAVLYDNYAPALLGIACRMVNDRELAEDLLQDSFIKIWRSFHQFDPAKARLFTWMMNITRNTCIDHHRSKAGRQQKQVTGNEFDRADADTTDAQVALADQSKAIAQFTQWLGTKYREVIDLVYIYGYTQQEVAILLSIPVGTVKTRCHEAIKQLRSMHSAHCAA